MYFVNREKIEQTLVYMEKVESQLSVIHDLNDLTEKLALERIAYVLIESFIDVGNNMIDGFIMRDPGGYEDIIDILEDEKVVICEDALALKALIGVRKQLVQNYTDVNHQQLLDLFITYKQAVTNFPAAIRRYLVEELGPVSAFLPK